MFACIGSGILLALTSSAYCRLEWLAVAVLVQLRLTANMLDGMVALDSDRNVRLHRVRNFARAHFQRLLPLGMARSGRPGATAPDGEHARRYGSAGFRSRLASGRALQ